MTTEEEDLLIEQVATAWRPRGDDELHYHKAWHDLDATGRARAYELATKLGMRLNTFLQNFTRARKMLADCLKRAGVVLDEELGR